MVDLVKDLKVRDLDVMEAALKLNRVLPELRSGWPRTEAPERDTSERGLV
jgi:hypothetical protein